MTFFELTTQQKKLAAIGQRMMDFSEYYGAEHGLKDVTDNGLRTLNNLSEVGYQLTHYGAVFGTDTNTFGPAAKNLIADFINNTVDIERK